MKIAITGHLSGIGKALANILTLKNHEVVGFDLFNGYNITNAESRNKIISQASDCDIFINNAQADFAQTNLLLELWSAWQGQNKRIINISSAYTTSIGDLSIIKLDRVYKTAKIALEDAAQTLASIDNWPYITTVLPGLVDTKSSTVLHSQNTSIFSTVEFAEGFYNSVIQPTNYRISTISILPNIVY